MTTPQTSSCALVINADPPILRLLAVALESNGYYVATAGTGKAGLTAIAAHRYDVVLLDLDLPDLSGSALLRQLREWTQTPVVMVTAHHTEADKIEALDAGADDFVTIPFNTGELLARLRAVLRRSAQEGLKEPIFQAGALTVDFASRKVLRNQQPVKLTATEYALLRLFVRHAGKVLTHGYILREVWGSANENQTQYLRVYVTRLRAKLEADPSAPALFVTEPGVGYRFLAG